MVDYLERQGWETTQAPLADLYAPSGVSVSASDEDEVAMFRWFSYVIATRA